MTKHRRIRSAICAGCDCRARGFVLASAMLAIVFAIAGQGTLFAQNEKDRDRMGGNSSPKAQADATKSIPYNDLSDDARRKVDAVLSGVTLFRRLPTQVIRCDPELYDFLIRHPDVTANMWQVLGISNCVVERTGTATFRAEDGGGARGDLQYLYNDHETQLVYAVGTYQGGLFSQAIKGGCLIVLKTGYVREPDGNHYITSRMDVFFRIDNAAVEMVTKTFQSMFAKSADHNFTESMKFVGQLSRVAEVRPHQIVNLSSKLDKVGDEERQKLNKLVLSIADRYESRVAQRVDDDEPPPELPRATIPPPKLRR